VEGEEDHHITISSIHEGRQKQKGVNGTDTIGGIRPSRIRFKAHQIVTQPVIRI